jgi:hypothetical protein
MSSDEFKPGKELSKIFKDLKEYFEIKMDIFKLEFIEKLVKSLSAFYTFLVLGSLISFSALFFSIAAACYFGELFNSMPLGFMLIGFFYFLMIILFLIFRRRLVSRPLIRFASKIFFKKSENHVV